MRSEQKSLNSSNKYGLTLITLKGVIVLNLFIKGRIDFFMSFQDFYKECGTSLLLLDCNCVFREELNSNAKQEVINTSRKYFYQEMDSFLKEPRNGLAHYKISNVYYMLHQILTNFSGAFIEYASLQLLLEKLNGVDMYGDYTSNH